MQERDDGAYAILWSGGKDGCLALWWAQCSGLKLGALVNFFDATSKRVRFHAVRASLILEQSKSLGMDLFCRLNQYGFHLLGKQSKEMDW